jgi:ABC-type glycerol-3-phosphate transport system substrate-binding protein
MSKRGKFVAVAILVVVLIGVTAIYRRWRVPKEGGPCAVQTLTVWQTETDKGATQRLAETIALFEKENPCMKVRLESVAWSSLSNKLAVALSAHNEPDVTHLEPFMVAQMYSRDLLLPIDDVIQSITTENDDTIYEGVLNLQNYKGARYGIAYAVGTTAFAYRKDIADKLHLAVPKTWTEYVDFVRRISDADPKLKLLLPGGDPFFIDQLFAELVANNGGVLFDPSTNRPKLTSRQVIETLDFLAQLSPYVDTGWQTQPYLDQFNRFARGEAGNVPVTYARASKAIESALKNSGSPITPDPEHFALMPQPLGPSFSGPSIATIDCEPYVIFKSAKDRTNAYGTNADMAKKFLLLLFRKDQYLPFVKEVPIHLTPIFQKIANSPDYLNTPLIRTWKPWADQTDVFLRDSSRLRPILMPDISEQGRTLPFLLDFQSSKILTQLVSDVVKNHTPPEQAAKAAQERAEQFVQSLGYKRW